MDSELADFSNLLSEHGDARSLGELGLRRVDSIERVVTVDGAWDLELLSCVVDLKRGWPLIPLAPDGDTTEGAGDLHPPPRRRRAVDATAASQPANMCTWLRLVNPPR